MSDTVCGVLAANFTYNLFPSFRPRFSPPPLPRRGCSNRSRRLGKAARGQPVHVNRRQIERTQAPPMSEDPRSSGGPAAVPRGRTNSPSLREAKRDGDPAVTDHTFGNGEEEKRIRERGGVINRRSTGSNQRKLVFRQLADLPG